MNSRIYAAIIIAYLGYVSSSHYSDGVGRFSYREDDNRQPARWNSVDTENNEWQNWDALNVDHNECGKESNKQSPIDLTKSSQCRSDHEILFEKGTCEVEDIKFEITPYSLKGTYPRDNFLRGNCTPPTLDLSDSFHPRYTNTFEMKVPSEHTINGTRYDAEIQFSQVENEAEEHKTNRNNQIVMTSRLLILDGKIKNDYIETYLQHWEYVAELKEEECNVGKGKTSFFSPKKTISTKKNFLRRNLKKDKTILHAPFRNQYYYGYRGSLTIPPCSDIVLWYVVDEPMKIGESQLARLKDLIMNYRDGNCRKSTYANSDGHVNRPLQPRNDRDVFHCDESDYLN